MLVEDLGKHTFEMGPIRPPSEGGRHSLLIRVTRNCPWSKCAFCYGTPYNGKKFELRSVEEIKKDIREAKAVSEIIKEIADKLGGMDWASTIIDTYFLYDKNLIKLEPKEMENYQCVVTVFKWLLSGGGTAFLQDADSLIIRSSKLEHMIKYLKEIFPSIERVTSYARAKTLYKRNKEDLLILKEAGLKRLHVGLESGDDSVLKYVKKGVTGEEHIEAGRKAKEVGFELSEYVMLGLGGRDMWEQHAMNTAKVLNEINPDFIRMRPLVPRHNTPLFEAYKRGEFKLTSPHERLEELRLFIANLEVTSRVCFDHVMNGWYKRNREPLFSRDYEGYKFPADKEKVLEIIEEGLEIEESFHMDARNMIKFQHL